MRIVALICLTVAVNAISPPARLTFETNTAGYTLHLSDGGVARMNVSYVAAKKPSGRGLMAIVTESSDFPTGVEVKSPAYELKPGYRYMYKLPAKTFPKDGLPFYIRVYAQNGTVLAEERFVSGDKWKTYSMPFTTVYPGNYTYGILIGKTKAAWMFDDIRITSTPKKSALKGIVYDPVLIAKWNSATVAPTPKGKTVEDAPAPKPAKAKPAKAKPAKAKPAKAKPAPGPKSARKLRKSEIADAPVAGIALGAKKP